MRAVKIVPLIFAVTVFLSSCSFFSIVGDIFFPKPENPAMALIEEVTRALNIDTFTVIDNQNRKWHQAGGQIYLDDVAVRRLRAVADSPISYIEGNLYYMAPEGFTRYVVKEEKAYPLHYDVMDTAVAGLNRIYYVRDNMLFSFFASETEIDAVMEAYLTEGYDVNIVDNLLFIQGLTICLLTDSVQR